MIWLSYDRGLGFRQEKAFQHYRLIVSQLAEKHNVKVDQLVLGLSFPLILALLFSNFADIFL